MNPKKLLCSGGKPLNGSGGESGFVLISVLVMCCILFIVAASQAAMVATESRQLRSADNDLKALAIAEAGVERAIWEVKHNDGSFDGADGWNVQGSTATLANVPVTGSNNQVVGTYTVTVENIDADPVISSQAEVAGAGQNREATVKASLEARPLFEFAILSEQPIQINNNATIDSYDSSLGDYNANLGGGQRNKGSEGDVGTLSSASPAITVKNNASIKGDAITGVGGQVSISNNGSVTGEIDDDISASLSNVTVPQSLTGLASLGALNKSNNVTHTLSAGSYRYSSVTFANNAKLKVSGEVYLYVTGSTSFKNNANLEIASGGKLVIYTDGSFTISNNGIVNNITKDPSAFQLYATSAGTITFNNNGNVYGTTYAPKAAFNLSNNAYMMGSVAAKSVTISNNAGVHFDTSLLTSGPSVGYDTEWWRRTA